MHSHDHTDDSTDLETDHDGAMAAPTKTGLRMLWILAGQARTPEAVRSELAASFDADVSIQTVERTARALSECDYITSRQETGVEPPLRSRQFVITARGRHVAYGELASALDHVDLSAAMATVGDRLSNAESARQPDESVRKTTLRGDEDVRTDGGRVDPWAHYRRTGCILPGHAETVAAKLADRDPDIRTDGGAVRPTFDTPLTYQARCGARDCGSLVGMSDTYCADCGAKIDWPAPGDDPVTGDDVPQKLLTGGSR